MSKAGSRSTPTVRRQHRPTAANQLGNILSLLNTQVGDNYIFSGSASNQPSVASESDILNGNGAQAGLTQVISERQQADLGISGLGHLSAATSGSTVTLSQDGTPFGFQLSGVEFQFDRRDGDWALGFASCDHDRSAVRS